MSNWTDERVELLTKLWRTGASASQIAAELGGTTRNAVLSKAHRLIKRGVIQFRADPQSGTRQRAKATRRGRGRRAKAPLPNRNTGIFPERLSSEPRAPEPIHGPDLVIPEAERRSLHELQPDDCRWPIGDPRKPGFHFCGKSKVPGSPYCEFHAQRAIQPQLVKPRDRSQPVRVNRDKVPREFAERMLGQKVFEDA